MSLAPAPDLHAAAELGVLLWTHLHLSLLAVGGAMTVAPELHRVLVDERGWLADADFTRGVTLAQAAPGPNVLYIALIGWLVGWGHLGAGLPTGERLLAAVLALVVSLGGLLGPSAVLACAAEHLAGRWAGHRAVRALREGLAPLVVAAMLASAWFIARGAGAFGGSGRSALLGTGLVLGSAVAVLATRLPVAGLLLVGAVLGAVLGQGPG